MSEALALVPLAVAAALSTVPISLTIFILLSDRRSAIAFPFLAGWVLGTAGTLTLATLSTEALPGRPRQLSSAIGSLYLVIGSVLVVLGLVTLLRARRTPATGQRPDWVENIGSYGGLPTFGIGLALNLRPKALLLVGAASLTIRGARSDAAETVVLIATYTVIATSSVVAPILATALFPTRMEPRLLAARDWIAAHGAALTAGIMIVVGVFVIGAGVAR